MASIESVLLLIKKWHAEGAKVVLATGSFDLYHPGHVEFIERVAAYGNKLVIGLNSDSFLKHKGPDRPIINEEGRMKQLMSNRYVDSVFVANMGKRDLVKKLYPNVVIINGTDTDEQHKGNQEAKLKSFREQFPHTTFIVYNEKRSEFSTTALIRKIRSFQ